METNPWDDDSSWWHQQDLELQEREEEERINACNNAVAQMKEYDDAE
jgi:hypothetical protein